jgi:hypothetical protein
MSHWAACLLTAQIGEFSLLRLFPGIEFAEVGGALWLRGNNLETNLEQELKRIPGLIRFELMASNRLRPVESRISDRVLPAAIWRPLKDAVGVTLPVAALSGETTRKVPLVLIRSSVEQPVSALRISLDEWVQYVTGAAMVRLNPLRFAAMEARQVLVLGCPLPAISGQRFGERGGLLVPCGFTWSPPVEAVVLRQLFSLGADDYVILAEDNTHQILRSEQFVPASRSAARRTLAEWNHA